MMLKDNNGCWIHNPSKLQDHILEFYKNLFSGNENLGEFQSWGDTHTKISQRDSDNMTAPILMEEI